LGQARRGPGRAEDRDGNREWRARPSVNSNRISPAHATILP
jgi:hypothetical protein